MLSTHFFQERRWVGVVLGLALGVATIGAPLAVQAQVQPQPQHQTLNGDVAQLQTLLNNAFFLEMASEACATRAVDLKVVAICTTIHTTQMQQVANDKWALTVLTGQRPWNPMLNATDQATITHLFFDTFTTQSDFVRSFGNALVGKFKKSLETSALCAGIGFTPLTRYFCNTLGAKDAEEDNAIQDYLTQTIGNTTIAAHK